MAGNTVTCSGTSAAQSFQVRAQNVTLINNGDWNVTGQMTRSNNTGVLGPLFTNANYNTSGTTIINNGNIEWLNALSRSETNRYALGMGLYYYSNVNRNMTFINNGSIAIKTTSTNFAETAGIANAARSGYMTLRNTGSIHVDNSVATSLTNYASGILGYGGSTDVLLQNSGDIYVDGGRGNTLGIQFVSSGAETPKNLQIENSGTIKIVGHSSVSTNSNVLIVDLLNAASGNVFEDINIVNSGVLEARNYDGDLAGTAVRVTGNVTNAPVSLYNTSTGMLAAKDAIAFTASSSTHLDLQNEGAIVGNITTANGQDIIRQSSGYITGNVNLGGDNDIFAMSGGYVDGSILMGNGDDQVIFADNADLSKTLLVDGGSGTNSMALMGAKVKGYTAAVSDIGKGVNLQSWNSINLTQSTLELTGDLFSAGQAGALNINAGSVLNNQVGNATIFGNLKNSGIIQQTGSGVLRIAGDYEGGSQAANPSYLVLSTITPQSLVIEGNATGTTVITIQNLGAIDPDQVNGIEIIDVQGVSSDAAFKQRTRIAAGVYDFTLVKGNADNTDTQGWFLTGAAPGSAGRFGGLTLRPEVASYVANLAAANTMFLTRLEDRKGDSYYYDPVTKQIRSTSFWVHYNNGQNYFNDNSGQIATRSRRNVMQMGGDIARWEDASGLNKFHAGLMAGYGASRGDSVSRASGFTSSSKIEGYQIGAYATWYANEKASRESGFRLDGQVNWNNFNAETNGQDMLSEEYDLQGITTSLEAGYLMKLRDYQNGFGTWIEPQAQIIWMGVTADDHIDRNGTRITGNDKNLQSRLGLKAHLYKPGGQLDPQSGMFSPFVALNWIKNNKPFSINMSNTAINQNGARNIGEFKIGLEGRLNQNAHLWVNAAQQLGSDNYRDTNIMLGAKWHF